ncbi:hypothetical protein BK136_24860 [Paenibacillus amylolyticus]|nr:hypothetical protein BK136_24860 [Paenibacillus amylolyticus]
MRDLAGLFADSVGCKPSVGEPCSAALRGKPAGQLLRSAAWPLLLRKAGLKGAGYARGQLLRLAAWPLLLRKAGLRARARPGGSCFAWLPWPLLLRKAGLKGSG